MDIFASITYVEITSQTLGINLLTCQILLVRLHSIAFESLFSSLPTRIHVTTPSHSLLPCSTCQASRAFLAFHLAHNKTNRKSSDSQSRFAAPPRSRDLFFVTIHIRTFSLTPAKPPSPDNTNDHRRHLAQLCPRRQHRQHRKIPAAHAHTAQVSCWNTSFTDFASADKSRVPHPGCEPAP